MTVYTLIAKKHNDAITYTGTLEEILNELEDEALQFNDSSMFCRSTRDIINLERDYGNEAAFYSYDNTDEGEEDKEREVLSHVTLRNRPLMLTPDTLCAYAEYVLDTPMSQINCVPATDS